MWKKRFLALTFAGAAALALSLPEPLTAAKAKPAKGKEDKAACYACHDEIKALKEGSKHANLACATCHDNLDKAHGESGATRSRSR